MPLCIGTRNDGTLCQTVVRKSAGYCKECDPNQASTNSRELAEVKKKEARKKQKEDQRQEILQEDIGNAILEITDLESLRRLELKILSGLINGDIDSRAGSPIVQILRHQTELLEKTDPTGGENLSSREREHAILLAKAMTQEQMLNFLSDFRHGMKILAKDARVAAAEDVTDVEGVPLIENKSNHL